MLFTSAADVAKLTDKSKSERKPNQPTVAQPMLELGGYNGHMEYRASVGNAAVHEKEAELFYVIDGSATLVTGGKLVDEKRTDATNLGGSAISGGTPREIAKGDGFSCPKTRRISSIPSTASLCCSPYTSRELFPPAQIKT